MPVPLRLLQVMVGAAAGFDNMSSLKKLETVAASVTHALEHCSVQPSLVSNCCKA